MKKKLCITTFVFGKSYQQYIPLYIYSILKSYKEYYPLIFFQQHLSESVHKQLNLLSDLGDFKVVEGYFQEHKLNNQQGKSIRWILDVPEFNEYQAVYIGDIDIFILPEQPNLYDQHCTHCETIKLPYSNVVRQAQIQKINKRLTKAIDIFTDLGLHSAIRFFAQSQITVKCLTGLQFVKTNEYFEKLRPIIPKYQKLILDNSFHSRAQTLHHRLGFHNECLLYDMMQDSGLGLPPQGPCTLDYRDYRQPLFRPIHGIHLGIFRDTSPAKCHRMTLSPQLYKEFYQEFCAMTENDPPFAELQKDFSRDINQLFANMHRYFRWLNERTS